MKITCGRCRLVLNEIPDEKMDNTEIKPKELILCDSCIRKDLKGE